MANQHQPASTREWDHAITYTLRSGQQGHIVLRLPEYPKDTLIKDALSKYGIDPSDVKKVEWVPMTGVRQSAKFAGSPTGSATAPPIIAAPTPEMTKGDRKNLVTLIIYLLVGIGFFIYYMAS